VSDEEKKVISLVARQKKQLSVAPEQLRDVSDIMAELIATMEAKGMKYLYGSYHGGWLFSLQKPEDSSGNGGADRG
jgi:hypothetical protein